VTDVLYALVSIEVIAVGVDSTFEETSIVDALLREFTLRTKAASPNLLVITAAEDEYTGQ